MNRHLPTLTWHECCAWINVVLFLYKRSFRVRHEPIEDEQ